MPLDSVEKNIAFLRPHHRELRTRLIKIFISIAVCTGIAYIFSQQIAGFLISPLFKASPLMGKLVYTHLPEAFLSYIKLSFLAGLITSFPLILYQIWAFMAPGLEKTEKKQAIAVVFWGSLLFAGGSCFALFAVLPKMLSYFMSYAHENLEPLPKLGAYLTFVARTVLAFGLAFQIPFLMIMTGRVGLVDRIYFKSRRIYFYGAILVLSFLLTAGDFMATALLAIPLFTLYETGILLLGVFGGQRKKNGERKEAP